MHTFQNYSNGRLVGSARSFESVNPATGEAIGLVPHSSPEQVAEAVAAARAAQPAWATRPDAERKALMGQLAQAIKDNAGMLAEWITREQGKPLGGVGEGQVPGAHFEVWACEVWTQVPASLDLPVEVVFEDATRRDEVHRKPHGVVAAIAPWNWPLMIAIWQIIPALRAGNTVVLKPSEYTSIGTLELVRVLGGLLPPGVLNTVSGAGDVGAALTEHPGVDKITFTGSTATGARIAATAARSVTPTTLELGGNDPAIVLPGTDPKAIAMGLFWGAFLNMGQTCACAKRLYVHSSLHDAVVAELKALALAMPMGDGMQPGMAMGPVQNRMQYDKVVALVEDARAGGATIVCGGNPEPGPGNFYPLTLVTGLADGARLVDEEQFGPVLPIVRYDDVEDAIASANRLGAGLGASVWGPDAAQAAAVAARIQAGTVWVNQHGAIHPMVPFGGTKRSGWGVEFGVEGLKGMTRGQVISVKK
ncbi:acyl-CoA reductase-like NAD-dependent aldehyde dehydrogenase [Acidovorax soli]|uniref:4-(hydroxymethyl)benzenesulfonate dehydrogenase n=1 Tax=Acidovorax soli TaxID=592050 RepID=A0A7X0PBU6_9BURK|nr:aldehyde dehydrogenase family protein [Acidovorax soli]MBB6559047.1 acyl-CoA reductase-like NAD-dependent aldehyde dehydrogenase [Acidovorax soli]